MRSFKEDYALGIQSEQDLLSQLDLAFEETYVKQGDYDTFDFKGMKSFIELKTRTTRVYDFNTTILPFNKIESAAKSDIPVYFVFKFTDALCYIEYDKKLFDTFKSSLYQRGQRSDYNDLRKKYIFIPVSELTEIIFE